jgi:DNA-directed RNA polymerase specialized sigma24 family protein
VHRLGVADSQLEDAVQDVFIVVHRRLPDFEGRSSMGPSTSIGAARRRTRWRCCPPST